MHLALRYIHIKGFFSYAGHGRTVAFIFSIDIQQFSINFLTIHTIIQYIPYDYNIVLGGHLRHYIKYQLYSNNFTSVEKTTFIRRRIFRTIFSSDIIKRQRRHLSIMMAFRPYVIPKGIHRHNDMNFQHGSFPY
jgi:hypothetical protein